MALQLHRRFSSGSLYRSFIAQWRGLQNFTGAYLPYSSFQNGGNYRKWDHIRLGKVKETCNISIDQGFKIESDFQFLRTLGDRYRLIAVTYKSQLSTAFPCPIKLSDVLTSGCVQNSVRLSSFSYQCIGRRCFSAKATEKSKVPSVTPNKNDNVRDGRSRDNNGSFKVFHEYRGRAKSLAGHSSAVAGDPQVAVSRQVVQTTASKTSKPDAKTLDVLKPKEQVGGGHKQDAQSGLSILPVAKVDGDNQKRNAVKKKKQRSRNKKHVEKDTATSVISGATKTEEVSRKEKPNFTKAIQSPQASDLIPVCETSLQAVDCPALVHQQSKKAVDCSTKNRKPPKNVTVKKSSKGPLDKKNGIGGKSDSRGKTLKPLYPPIGKSVVVVESLAKAKIIQGYLGDMFEVLPSYGHVRDLAGRSGSVRPDDDFSMVWEVPSAAWTHLKSIKVALNGAKNLILASDPDREGEAVAWHIIEMLQQQDALHDNLTVARVVYKEITEVSIKSALQAPREINMDLVHAYLARRAIDYLIGFSISPLLWKKLPGCQSAGRVQSAALSLICDRETEIDEFRQQEYWTVEAEFNKEILGSLEQCFPFSSRLIHFDFKKLEKLSICSSSEAEDMHHKITSSSFEVVSSKRSKIRKNPPMPYITSTLQQDAANKMHFSPLFTMKLAQKLFEGVKLSDDKATGLITYMRTDGLHVSDAASEDIRSLVLERYGQGFAPKSARKYFKKVKNAQEAHEAIRPTDIRMLPSMLAGVLDEDSLKLYTLIWSRTMACQMEPAVIDQIQIDAGGAGKSMLLRSTWSRSEFLGYQAVYKDAEVAAVEYNEEEGKACEKAFKFLCTLKSGDPLCLGKVEVKPQVTQPPPRYTEGSLIKKLEELGIGRPSTYGTTIKILQDRSYVTIKSRVLYPEFRARMVSQYLSHHFSEVNDYSFTADMENELDNVSAGFTEWKGLMKDYWTRFNMYCSRAGNVDVRQVEKMLEETFGHVLFSSLPDKSRTCPSCSTGTLIFKVSRLGSGYFIACDQHSRCKYIAKTIYGDDEEEDTPQRNELFAEPKVLGLHPASNEKIFLKNGPYGFYVQLGEDRKGYIPKRAAVSQIKNVESITLEDAIDLLRYPITLGNHPDDDQPVYLKLARQGYTIRHRRTIAPVPKSMNPKSVTLEKAVKLLLSDKATRCGRPKNKPKSDEVYEAV